MILTVTLNTSIDKLYMLDRLEPYAVMRVNKVNNTAGGKGLNVSRIAAMAGESVTAMGFVGGYNGQFFESLITQPNIHRAFTNVRNETRCCINVWDVTHKKSTEYLEPGAKVDESDIQMFLSDFKRELAKVQVVTISGSMPAGVPADFYALLISLCKDAGKPVLLDTSGEALRCAVKAVPTLIKPNTDELTHLIGKASSSRAEIIAAARELHANGIERVVISQGAQGALMVCGDGVYHGQPPFIEPVNTVGCGDSMIGGFAIGYARGWHAEESLRYAVAVSAANALSMDTGSYDPPDLDKLLPKVIIRKICS